MTDILSEEEIDALLKSINPEAIDLPTVTQRRRAARCYDFRRPDRFTKMGIRIMQMIFEQFSTLATNRLAKMLGRNISVSLASVDQLTYEEFIRSIPNPTYMSVLDVSNMDGPFIIEIDPSCTHDIIRSGIKPAVSVSEEDCKKMSDLIIPSIATSLNESWEKYNVIVQSENMTECNPRFLTIIPPGSMILLMSFEIKTEYDSGMMNICIAADSFKNIRNKLTYDFWFTGKENLKITHHKEDIMEVEQTESNIDTNILARMMDMPVQITVELGRTRLLLKDVLKLGEGSILELTSNAGEPVSILAGSKLIAKGEVVVIDENFGIRITDLMLPEKQPDKKEK